MALIAIRPTLLRDAADLRGEGEEGGVAEEPRGGVCARRGETTGRIHGPLNLERN
jgi:hypothetical protein